MWTVPARAVEAEVERLRDAIAEATRLLEERRQRVLETTGEQDASILAVHRMVLQDPNALTSVGRRVREQRINAEAAVQGLIDELHATMSKLEGDSVRGYGADMSEPWKNVLDILLKLEFESFASTGEPLVLAAAELTPQVVTCLPRERILAIVAAEGGRFSHGAVLARSFGVPCVVGLPNLLARLEQDMHVLVDGERGTVQLEPDQEALAAFRLRCLRGLTGRAAWARGASGPATTKDGASIQVQVNLESLHDLDTFDLSHADGVGLLRTEFLYMERSLFPSEEEQFRLYRRVLEHMEGKTVLLRTLDIGGDKKLPYFQTPDEANPQLGWRGLRLVLEWQDLLRVQLRAALRASVHGPLGILLPMVTSIEEIRAVREIFDGVRSQLLEQGYEVAEDVPVGIMIEVPSTVFVLEELVQEVNFVSVGTNDLTQYLLAVDRDNPLVSKLYEPAQPAVLRALARIAEVARAADKPCGVCGEFGADSAVATFLLGLGYQSVSVAPNFLAELRHTIRSTTMEEARAIAARLVAAGDLAGTQAVLEETRQLLHDRILAEHGQEPGPGEDERESGSA